MATNYFESFSSDFEILKGTFGDMKSRIALISSELDTMNATYYTLTSNISGNLNWDDPMQKATEIRMTKTVDALKLIRDSVDDSVVPLIQKTLDTYFTTILSIKEKQKEYENALRLESYYEAKSDAANEEANTAYNNDGYGPAVAKAQSLWDKSREYGAKANSLKKELVALKNQANNEKQSIKNSDTAFTLSNISASLDIASYDAAKASGTSVEGGENYYSVDISQEGIDKAKQYIAAQIAVKEQELDDLIKGKVSLTDEEVARAMELQDEIERLRQLQQKLYEAESLASWLDDTEEDKLRGNLALVTAINDIYGVETGSIDAGSTDVIDTYTGSNGMSDNLSDLSKYMGPGSEPISEEDAPAILTRLSNYNDQAMADYKSGLIDYAEYERRMDISRGVQENLQYANLNQTLGASSDLADSQFWVHENSSDFIYDMNTIRNIDSQELDSAIRSSRSLETVEAELRSQYANYDSSNDKAVLLTNIEMTSKIEEGVRTGEITPAKGRELLELVKDVNHKIYWDSSTPGLQDAVWDLDREVARESLEHLINDRERSTELFDKMGN